MRYFFDTEFIESGAHKPIDLISIGIVAEDGRELYVISSEFNADEANDWVKANVLPHLGIRPDGDMSYREFHVPQKLATIAEWVKEFCDPAEYGAPEFWAYFADYDWVVFCQIFGSMVDLPKGFPMFCRDIKQLACDCGNPGLPAQDSIEHNALNDARWNKLAYEYLEQGQKLPNYEIVEEFDTDVLELLEMDISVETIKARIDHIASRFQPSQRGPKA
jgi:hypothetical protein